MLLTGKQVIHNNVYVVLGMPRSGTSAITKALEALGIYLGDQLIPAKSNWNAKGYFEDKEIVQSINKKILNTLFDNWESIKILEQAEFQHPSLKTIRENAIKVIQARYQSKPHWGFKDPRTTRVLPFWKSVFAELNITDQYVITLRNPLASAHSFMNLTKIDLEKGLLLWLAHLIPAIDETINKKRIVVSYDLLLQNPNQQLSRLQTFFQLTGSNAANLETYANEFLDHQLKHYHFSDDDFKAHPATRLIPHAIKIYDLLLKLAKDEIGFEDEYFITTWRDLKEEWSHYLPLYSYMDTLLKRNKEQERKLKTINKSIPWKLVYPLRLVEEKIKVYRRRFLFN